MSIKKPTYQSTNVTRAQELVEKKRDLPPEVTSRAVRGVSQARRDMLEQEVSQGVYREQGHIPVPVEQDVMRDTVAGFATSSSKPLYKTASTAGTISSSSGWGGGGGTVRQAPEVYSPLWLNSNLNLPRDRVTINAWSRSFFALNPMVHNAITLHSTYPIAKLNIKCKDQKVEKFFNEMIEEIDLMNVCSMVAQEYWTIGEAFPYAELDQSKGRWSNIMILNPDYVNVQRSVISAEPIISLRPDENLKRVVFGNKPSDIQQRMQLDPTISAHIRKNENIPLNNFHVSHLARRIAPYEVRGTGLIVSCFRSLMLLDKIFESKFAQADSFINPLTMVKIGNQDFRPTPADLEHWREIFENASSDKNFKIFTHDAVSVEPIGFGSAIYNTEADVDRLVKFIYVGLMVPSVIMDGSDTTYATGSVALDVLRQRYMQFRNFLSSWLRNRIFAPISMINDFYDYSSGEKVLIVPEIDWNHMSLFDMDSYINNLMQLSQGEGSQKRVSQQTLYRSLGLDYNEEHRKMRYEDIQDAIRTRELANLGKYSLHELKTIKPGEEIDEISEDALPGESSNEFPGAISKPSDISSAGLGPIPGTPPSGPIGSGGAPPPVPPV